MVLWIAEVILNVPFSMQFPELPANEIFAWGPQGPDLAKGDLLG